MATEATKKARQKPLPGMGKRIIQDLQDAALSYAEVRDERMGLSKREGELKADLLRLMHKHKKTEYSYNGVTVTLVIEEETVRVRVRSPKEDDEEESESEE
jgi:predicted subunit of tRNA(5-methylaminomethyl-2-thiouridylate) methyltransferase